MLARPLHPAPIAVRWQAFALTWTLLAVQVVASYQSNWRAEHWFAVQLLVGWAWLAVVLGAAGLRQLANRRALAVLGTTAVAITAFWYGGRIDTWQAHLEPLLPTTGWARPVWAFAFFSAAAALFRMAVPALVAYRLRLPLREIGWSRGDRQAKVWPVYVALYLAVLPFVIHAAGTPAFQAKYPMARALITPDHHIAVAQFVAYQLLYLLVFVSGECFWRGWICFGLRRDLGPYAILVMLVPYVCAHWGKPLGETLGAIAAGSVLGWLALAHRSVWLGAALHYAVALTMDLVAMWHAGIALQ